MALSKPGLTGSGRIGDSRLASRISDEIEGEVKFDPFTRGSIQQIWLSYMNTNDVVWEVISNLPSLYLLMQNNIAMEVQRIKDWNIFKPHFWNYSISLNDF